VVVANTVHTLSRTEFVTSVSPEEFSCSA